MVRPITTGQDCGGGGFAADSARCFGFVKPRAPGTLWTASLISRGAAHGAASRLSILIVGGRLRCPQPRLVPACPYLLRRGWRVLLASWSFPTREPAIGAAVEYAWSSHWCGERPLDLERSVRQQPGPIALFHNAAVEVSPARFNSTVSTQISKLSMLSGARAVLCCANEDARGPRDRAHQWHCGPYAVRAWCGP